ncbi:MAG: thioredoxin-dependent thiol peroxidase [Bacteroidales bacterium]|nr:thioredoxin-dependent thiol peroxidase [Bacteroidales bacterium]
MTHLKEGDKAPVFSGKNQEGDLISLENFKGKKVVLYFYPKDDTPGCTAEACNLRDNYDGLIKKGFEVIGVSPDTGASHEKFKSKYNLPFTLISDTEKKILSDYGAWGEKSMYGKKYMGVLRTTFVINEKGIIEKIFTKVDTKNHTAQILEGLGLE